MLGDGGLQSLITSLHPLLLPLSSLKGVGPTKAQKLAQHDLILVRDLLLLCPRRIQHLPLLDLPQEGEYALRVKVEELYQLRKSCRIACTTPSGKPVTVLWIRLGTWLRRMRAIIKPGSHWIISGRIEERMGELVLIHPEWAQGQWQEKRPLYPSILSQKEMRALVRQAIDLISDEDLCDPTLSALCKIHKCEGDFFSLMSLVGQGEARVQGEKLREGGGRAEALPSPVLEKLPFTLTSNQRHALQEIFQDLRSDKPMSRLLQGDVGSGKTIVALLAACHVIKYGFHCVFMSPTTLLAEQHYKSAQSFFPLVESLLYLGSKKSSSKELKPQAPSIIFGTHNLLYTSLPPKVALVIIDEQHRFGVQQRLQLRGEGIHTLSMSATPIPRSLRLSTLGYLALSTLREKPQGRLPVKTYVKPIAKIQEVYTWVKAAIDKDFLVYWVCPRIIENLDTERASVEHRFRELDKHFGPKVAVVHGKSEKKDLKEFKSGVKPLLLTTTLIEVGLDLPEARAIVIEEAEQYGLAQLHQLRGRVGRGKQGFCILLYKNPSEQGLQRLQIIRNCSDGFEIAEKDREMRGHGDVLGSLQAGTSTLRFIDFVDWKNSPVGEPTNLERVLWGERPEERDKTMQQGKL